MLALALTAVGVVFGDIGTSPLYSLQTVFSLDNNRVAATHGDVYGVLSLVFWSVTLVVSVKYVALVMRADNEGEGGILALTAKLRASLKRRPRELAIATMMGILGAALFFGDSLITPAISVMSAIEGIAVEDNALQEFVLPISVVILTALFIIQRWGTHIVGRAFGPVMVLWFVVLALLGLPHIVAYPMILTSISPHYAVLFILDRPLIAFVSMGAVVLTITGAEALYADMGHLGPRPIKLAWFALVFPALMINYLGQAAMILTEPSTAVNPFFLMAPGWATLPLVVLSTMATVIASQAVISGTYSVAYQAMRLGLFPRLKLKHTSSSEAGQIYLPAMNWILFVGVLLLISIFRSSARLATAYGLAVTGTLLLTTSLFLLLAKRVWNWSWGVCVAIAVVIGGLEVLFFGANLLKIVSGGWLPLVIAFIATSIMLIWRSGARRQRIARIRREGTIRHFLDIVHSGRYQRIPGLAVFPHPTVGTTPLALRSNVEFNHVVHEQVVMVTIITENVPHIRHVDRVTVDDLGNAEDGITQITVRVGFNDSQDVPKALANAAAQRPELGLDCEKAFYFLSLLDVRRDPARQGLGALADSIYVWLSHIKADPPQVYHLPSDRTVVMGEQLQL
ncbi:MAG TPA: KUP/HAK/KT family potassium transporter [Propionibacteriaceae bacterium]|nr:KUP/HAK/KT family potassium transporter [Propionibacteriaceae bacterium]